MFSIILDYAHKEEITPEDRKNFLEKLANVEQLCIGGCDYHYQYATSDFIELVFQLKNLKYLDMSYLRIEGDDIRSIEASELECLLAKHGILVTYLKCEHSKFKGFIDKYKQHITEYAPESYNTVDEPQKIRLDGEFISCMKMEYEIGELYFTIYHIIVRFPEN